MTEMFTPDQRVCISALMIEHPDLGRFIVSLERQLKAEKEAHEQTQQECGALRAEVQEQCWVATDLQARVLELEDNLASVELSEEY